MKYPAMVLVLSAVFAAAACGGNSREPVSQAGTQTVTVAVPKPETDTDHGHHAHSAPHGGTLVVLGEEMAHLELLLDTSTGQLVAYALDGEAENAIRLKQPEIEIRIAGNSGMAGDTIRLKAVANVLTGETSGDASQFEGSLKSLSGKSRFEGIVHRVELMGILHEDVPFRYPEGNEDPE
ncbi:MAG: hypothetical protein AAB229_01875 [Candidatus Hydrogenedentota bacterium]